MNLIVRSTLLLTVVGCAGADITGADITMPAAGLKAPAEILIDRWGVPHIFARSRHDAFFAQGFNVARDRLFQIDLWRRRGLGQLAEVLGPAYVKQDQAARLFLYRGDMKKEWAAYGPDAQRIATAFVAGINAYVDWLANHPDRLPPEFQHLGYRPSPWEASDVVRIRSHGLTGNLTSEVARANVVCKTDPQNGLAYDQVRLRLEPAWTARIPEGLDPCLPPDVLQVFTLATANVRFGKDLLRADAGHPPSEIDGNEIDGSNNWVIAPSKSATGRPILANDPHRAYSTPSLRYIAHVSAPGMNLIGAGEPALPGISIGHNGSIAFGITRFYIDQEDLYVYELNPANPREYRYRQAWEPMRVVRETIRVRGAAPVEAELEFTRHGPVIYRQPGSNRAYAVRSGWLEPGTAAYFGSAGYATARNFAGLRRGASAAPGLNYVYADVRGHTGWFAAGLAPIRPNWDGLLPVPGDGRFEWAGFWPADKLPGLDHLPAGYMSTSNEMNLPSGYPHAERKLGFEWVNPSRHARIEEVLKPLAKVTLEDSMRLQNDLTSIPGRRLAALLATVKSSDSKTQSAIELLRGWDGVESAGSAQAALAEVWMSRHLPKAFLAATLPRLAAAAVATPDMAVMLEALEKPGWEVRDRVLLPTLGAAYREMESRQGADPQKWQWGRMHHALPPHLLGDALTGDLRQRLQPGPYPKGGGGYTPNLSTYRAADFQLTTGPSFRMVLDVGSWDNSRAMNFPGQSGNPDDPHYRDLAPWWLSGEYFPLLYTRAAVEKAAQTRILLQPAKR